MAAHESTEVRGAAASVPLEVRIGFAHACLQWIADRNGVDLLHVKGAALDPTLVPGRGYSDADVLARPEHVADPARRAARTRLGAHQLVRLRLLLRALGDVCATATSASSTCTAIYPGAGPTPGAAFDTLWAERTTTVLGGVECTVPVARRPGRCSCCSTPPAGGGDPKGAHDIESVWTSADDDQRARILEWVDRLDAGLAFSVITGTLDDHRDDPAYDLWRVASRGGTRLDEWRARVRAAHGLRAKLAVAARSVLVNVEHLTHRARPTGHASGDRDRVLRPTGTRAARAGRASPGRVRERAVTAAYRPGPERRRHPQRRRARPSTSRTCPAGPLVVLEGAAALIWAEATAAPAAGWVGRVADARRAARGRTSPPTSTAFVADLCARRLLAPLPTGRTSPRPGRPSAERARRQAWCLARARCARRLGFTSASRL